MRFLRTTALALLTLLYLAPAATADALTAQAVETHEFRYQIDGHPVTAYVHLFRESPYNNPALLEQIGVKGSLDHVAFLDEEAEQDRGPSALNNFEQLQEDIAAVNPDLPIINVRQKKGFFKKLGQLWNVSFNRSTRKPIKSDFTFGIASVVGEAIATTTLVVTGGGISVEAGIGLVVASTTLAYVNNVWNDSINYFLSGGKKMIQEGAKSAKFWALSLIYDFVQSQALKWIQVGADIASWKVQSTILMNTVVSGFGDTKLNNSIYRAYGDDKTKLARANYYINSISSTFSAIDLMQNQYMPVLMEIGAYDLRMSAPILIGYYIFATMMVTKFPNTSYKVVDAIHQSVQKVKGAFQSVGQACKNLLKKQSDDSGPNDGMIPVNP